MVAVRRKRRVMISLPVAVFREFRAFAIGRDLSQARAGELIVTTFMGRGLESFLQYLAEKQYNRKNGESNDTGRS